MTTPYGSTTLVLLLGVLLLAGDALAQTDEGWKAHDFTRPRPVVVTPGPATGPVAPPSDAIVLFDGTDLSKWQSVNGGAAPWKVEGGYMETVAGSGFIQTKQAFGDVQLHVEWAAPVPAVGSGQGRGNSGVFLMGHYEIQVLDSYENDTYPDGQAAAAYGQAPPLVNVARPPGEWQTYDIIFRRPHFAPDGSLKEPARITVIHNGVLVQDHTAYWGPTSWLQHLPYTSHAPRLPLILQDHDNPVRFRNIWIRELDQTLPPPVSPPPAEPIVQLDPATLDGYVGTYQAGGTTLGRVFREGNALYIDLFNRAQGGDAANQLLLPHSTTDFSMHWTAGDVTFTLDDAGVPSAIRVVAAGFDLQAPKAE